MKATPTTSNQTRAPGLYDEQLQRVEQERLIEGEKRARPKGAFFTRDLPRVAE